MSISAPTGYRTKQVQNFTPEMMQLFQQLLGGASGGLQGGLKSLQGLAEGDEEAFGKLEAPAYSAFQGALGQIGSRFAGAGALGSSAFQNATSGAAQSLAENLGSQRQGLQQGAIDKLLGLSTSLLEKQPYQNILQKKRSGWDTAGDVASIIGKLLPAFL